jgi:antitoxin VapB
MTARTASAFLSAGIVPTVLLMAVDDRIRSFKHAPPRGATLKKYGMLNLCARRHGLVVSITRFVHFGPMPSELAENFIKVAAINARIQHATRKGITAAEIYAETARAYADAGAPEEIERHHQGGAAGYGEREWLITPEATAIVSDPEVFAWNPSLRGAKAEDTTLLQNGVIEILTPTPELPSIETEIAGTLYRSPGVLIR